jgi:hypothetical protein
MDVVVDVDVDVKRRAVLVAGEEILLGTMRIHRCAVTRL